MSEQPSRRNTATSPEGQRARPTTIEVPRVDQYTLALAEEGEFVTQWYHLAHKKHPVALEMIQFVPSEAIQDRFWQQAYAFLSQVYAKGEQVDSIPVQLHLQEIANKNPGGQSKFDRIDAYFGISHTEEDLRTFGRKVLSRHRARSQEDLLYGAYQSTREALANGQSVKSISDRVMDNLISLHSRLSEHGGPVTQEEITRHLLAKLDSGKANGYSWPWPLLQKKVGLISPGKVYGITAYSGNGKTLLMCNLFRELVIRGTPVIVFPTEMDLQWMERVVATLARIPKEFAEEGDWRTATSEQMDRYREAMRAFVGLQWDIVQQPGISPAEIMARVRVLRRKYRGQQVVVIVDHMHRLDYGNVSADDAMGAGKATEQFKNMARADREGGLTWFVLFQPKKPEEEAKQFRPVTGASGIRGHGSAYNEVDLHISPWRRVVKCTEYERTEWGSPLAIYEKETDNKPARASFGENNSKVDDEHVYLTVDKDRIRGADLETLMLNLHAPSGYIYEQDYLRDAFKRPTERK